MTKALAADRFRLLLRQLAAEGRTQTQIAAATGIDQTLVSKIMAGHRSAGLKAITSAMEKLRIRREFFFEPMDTDPQYAAYRTSGSVPPDSRLDPSDADLLPSDEEADLAFAQQRHGLTDEETQKIRGVRRSVGRMELKAMLELAETIVSNRTGKAVERGQVAETKVPGNLKRFGKRGGR